MQLQFEKQGIPCLQTVKRELQSQEQTQELRISDGVPDIGSIIGAWGQVIVRGKEWQGDGFAVTGGTMVWVQYQPEEGGQPQWVESWLPFQMRWNFPQSQPDGRILTQVLLDSVDARVLSSRKMMLRTNVSALGWAMVKQEQEVFAPKEIPEDVQLRREQYPMELPVEIGEKAFALEDTLELPPSAPSVEEVLRYSLQPEITEEKMMADKVVFRGNAVLYLVYRSEDGGEYSWQFDMPFTQYSDLEGEYGEDARVQMLPCVTALEIDREGSRFHVKAGLVCQYRIRSISMVDVVTDAFSNRRTVTPSGQDLKLPGILEHKTQNLHIQHCTPLDAMRLTDVQCMPQPVRVQRNGDETTLEIPGQFRTLYYDMDGTLCCGIHRWQEQLTIPTGEDTVVEALAWPAGKPQGTLMSGSAQLGCDLTVITETHSQTPIPMITGLELGELQQPDPRRPSLILRRSGGQNVWELAKQHGSSQEAIRRANGLDSEPEQSQMLLIPVM